MKLISNVGNVLEASEFPKKKHVNSKGTQRNEIWQMDVFHFAEFGKLAYVHHTIDTYSRF